MMKTLRPVFSPVEDADGVDEADDDDADDDELDELDELDDEHAAAASRIDATMGRASHAFRLSFMC